MRKFIVTETDGYTHESREEHATRLGVAKGQIPHLERDQLLALRSAIQSRLKQLDAIDPIAAPVLGGEG